MRPQRHGHAESREVFAIGQRESCKGLFIVVAEVVQEDARCWAGRGCDGKDDA